MSDLDLIGELTAELERSLAQNKLATYEPYEWQQEFHDRVGEFKRHVTTSEIEVL